MAKQARQGAHESLATRRVPITQKDEVHNHSIAAGKRKYTKDGVDGLCSLIAFRVSTVTGDITASGGLWRLFLVNC